MATTIRRLSGRGTDGKRHIVHQVDKVRIDAIRNRAGAAELRLVGTVEEQSADIGRAHQAMVRRRQGVGPFGDALIEVFAHELNGRDTTPMLEALIATQVEARRAAGTALVLEEASEREQVLDAAEDVAQVGFHRTRCPRRWEAAVHAHYAFVLSHLLPAIRSQR